MCKVIRKAICMVLMLTLVGGMLGQTAMAKNNGNGKGKGNGKSNEYVQEQEDNNYGQEFKKIVKSLEFDDETRSAKYYDELALEDLVQAVDITTSSSIIINEDNINKCLDECEEYYEEIEVDSNEDLLDDLVTFNQLIDEYEQAIEDEYIYDIIVKSDKLLNIKHKLTIYISAYRMSNKLDEDTKVLLTEALYNLYQSDRIVCRNAIGNLTYVIQSEINKGTRKNLEAKLKNANKQYVKADEFLNKGLGIPAAKAYENAYNQVLKGLEKAGYGYSEALFESENDTDEDNLTDGIEFLIGTNPFNKDTDGDGLNDFVELYILKYNPLSTDTDLDEVRDFDEDIDEDGISNGEEIQIGSDPLNKDSDFDGLLDNEEIQFGTSPILSDTDGDGIKDADEIKLNLNPLNVKTNDVRDNEYCTKQILNSDYLGFEDINNENNDYDFFMEGNVAGLLEGNFMAVESPLSNILENKAVVGKIIDIEYMENQKIDSLKLNFKINRKVIEKALEEDGKLPENIRGINRYAIFTFSDEEGLAIPIDAVIDTDTDTISCDVKKLGTYYVVDIKKWFENMGEIETIEENQSFGENNQRKVSSVSLMSINAEELLAKDLERAENIKDNETNSKSDTRRSLSVTPTISTNSRTYSELCSYSNDYIAYSVKNNTGRFSIGTKMGDPNNENDDNKKLLYGFPNANTSYTTFRIDGTDYIFNTSNTQLDSVTGKITSKGTINGMEVVQELIPVSNIKTGREDIVKIKYTVKNYTPLYKQMGIRIMMDTMLGSNDGAPFRIMGEEVLTEREYTGDQIPNIWQAFDDLNNPNVVSQGSLLINQGCKPTKVQFANWRRLYNNSWDYPISTGSSIGDSAVAVIWDNVEIAPGSYSFETYYGVSAFNNYQEEDVSLGIAADVSVEKAGCNYIPIDVKAYISSVNSIKNVKLDVTIPNELEFENSAGSSSTLTALSVAEIKPYVEINKSIKLKVNKNYKSTKPKTVVVKYKLCYETISGEQKVIEAEENIELPNSVFNIIDGYDTKVVQFASPLNVNNKVDTDEDGLTDCEEINLKNKYVTVEEDGAIKIDLTLRKYIDEYVNGEQDKIKYFEHCNAANKEDVLEATLMPIITNPSEKDSDNDGYIDSADVSNDSWDDYSFLNDEIYQIEHITEHITEEGTYEHGFLAMDSNSTDATVISYEEEEQYKKPRFRFIWVKSKGYKIASLHNETKVLTVNNGNVVFDKDVEANNQFWQIIPQDLKDEYNSPFQQKYVVITPRNEPSKYLSFNNGISLSDEKVSMDTNIWISSDFDWMRFGEICLNYKGWQTSDIVSANSKEIYERYKYNYNKNGSNNDITKEINLLDDEDMELLIYQSGGKFKELKFGEHATMNNVCCEIMATYNAMKLAGYNVEYLKLATEFDKNARFGEDLIGGRFGSNPQRIEDCLIAYDVEYNKVNNERMYGSLCVYESGIVSYGFGFGHVELHTFAARSDGIDSVKTYNSYSNRDRGDYTDGKETYKSIEKLLKDRDGKFKIGYLIKPTLIVDLN